MNLKVDMEDWAESRRMVIMQYSHMKFSKKQQGNLGYNFIQMSLHKQKHQVQICQF